MPRITPSSKKVGRDTPVQTRRKTRRSAAAKPETQSITQKDASTSRSNMADSYDMPMYFWRETTELGWMSQWYPSPFNDEKDPSIVYKTAEHYMMYQKAILFDDPAVGVDVLAASHPRKAKTLGRKVHNFSDAVWNAEREGIVRQANLLKFRADETLRGKLLATGDRELVEASPYDSIWGIGFTAAKAEGRRAEWGLNLLGKALMDVRKTLREEGGP